VNLLEKELTKYDLPNIVIKWLTLLLRIQEVTDSDLGPEKS
jgi:hypothetical protein